MARPRPVPDIEVTNELGLLVEALLRRNNHSGLFVLFDLICVGFVSKFFAVKVEVLHHAQINKMTTATPDLDVVFLFHITTNFTVISQSYQIQAFEDGSGVNGKILESAGHQQWLSLGIEKPWRTIALDHLLNVVANFVDQLLPIGFDLNWVQIKSGHNV